MKKITLFLLVILGNFISFTACNTKEINLITNVNFTASIDAIEEGLVRSPLETTLVVIPQRVLPEFEYYVQYEVLSGDGFFEDIEGKPLLANEKNILNPELDFSMSLFYKGVIAGEH